MPSSFRSVGATAITRKTFRSRGAGVFSSREWLAPTLISEIIGRAEFIVASSLHACITALSYGVPGARVPIVWGPSKFDLLDEFAGIASIDDKDALSSLIRRGRQIEPRVIECADRLDRYWDMVRDVALHPPVDHCNRSRTVLLCWVTKVCGDRRHLGFARRFIVPLRRALAGYVPHQRAGLRRWLCLLKDLAAAAFQKMAQHRKTTDGRNEERGRHAAGPGGLNRVGTSCTSGGTHGESSPDLTTADGNRLISVGLRA
jgi:hypothetical protein